VTEDQLVEADIPPDQLPGAAHAAEHASIGLLPLFATCDRWDIGGVSTALHPDTGQLTVFVYDGHPGGAGFAERAYARAAAWLTATRDALGVRPLVYLNQSARDGSDWTPVVQDDVALWLARWDGSTDACGSGPWPALAMKQYSDTGTVPGVAGPVDLDVFYGTEDQLRAHGRGAGPVAAPSRPPV
jgi:hypothetical protein